MRIIIMLLCCLALDAYGVTVPFWQPMERGRTYIPQPRPEKFILDDGDREQSQVTMEYVSAPAPRVPEREQHLTFYPCSQCHIHWQTDPQPRKLAPVHKVGLTHGAGRLWCLDCHARDDRDRLRTLQDDPIEFDEAWRLCGQCHAARQKDWFFGAHGKRVYDWQGEAERYNCTHCHDPHRPRFVKRRPQAKPGIRSGLKPTELKRHEQPTVWEKKLVESVEEKNHE